MSPVSEMAATEALLDRSTSVRVHPRYEGSNICTWIGFKHVNYLVEEAVLAHLRAAGRPARSLFEQYALGTDIVAVKTRILTALHLDDVVTAEVVPAGRADDGVLRFAVDLTVDRDGVPAKAVSSTVSVALRLDERTGTAQPVPATLAPYVTTRLGTIGRGGRRVPDTALSVAPAVGTALGDGRGRTVDDPVLARLLAGRNAFGWRWRMPYFYCHFTQRVQMSGYLRQMEEIVDLFLADRGISIRTLLEDRAWIPVVPRCAMRLLDEALMEEELYTVYTVTDIYKDVTYTAQMDTYVVREGRLLQTATGTITHGYAVIENRRDWSLVTFDERVLRALRGEST